MHRLDVTVAVAHKDVHRGVQHLEVLILVDNEVPDAQGVGSISAERRLGAELRIACQHCPAFAPEQPPHGVQELKHVGAVKPLRIQKPSTLTGSFHPRLGSRGTVLSGQHP
jgi:hypothetical protein